MEREEATVLHIPMTSLGNATRPKAAPLPRPADGVTNSTTGTVPRYCVLRRRAVERQESGVSVPILGRWDHGAVEKPLGGRPGLWLTLSRRGAPECTSSSSPTTTPPHL
ncbi:hypothetical protein NHX12_020019 [Muraenolepis orangiensis]|uniref:Uncharacterized protein n=1 Tax=Muraenolepis orangiensis TaxID=630683 RepID=A0A9Q0EYE0_9TELE|nr:hypothetical protein NHX12_020019 [Muraenolepis orangiensis]